MFLWSGDSCECLTLHSKCPRHTLALQPRFRARVTLSWFYVESSIKVCFSAAVIAAFLCTGDSCECQTLHSICSRHTLQACTMTRCPWSRFRARVTLSWFYVESSIKVCFSEAVITASVKPCIVNVLDILFKHALWPGALDLDFTLLWCCHDFTWSLAFYVESSSKVRFSVAMIAASVKLCIVIVSNILFKQALWLGALDLDFALEWLCHDFTSSLALKCISLKRW